MIKLYIADIIENGDVLPIFSGYRKEKLCKITDKLHLYQSATAERLLCYAAKKENVALPLEICVGEHKKPSTNGFCFNISHSGGKVAVAVSKTQVGVDIEKINPLKNLDKLKKMFTEDDAENMDINRFYECFTKKESYYKMHGESMPIKSVPLKTFENCVFKTQILGDYVVTVCSPAAFDLQVENVASSALLNL